MRCREGTLCVEFWAIPNSATTHMIAAQGAIGAVLRARCDCGYSHYYGFFCEHGRTHFATSSYFHTFLFSLTNFLTIMIGICVFTIYNCILHSIILLSPVYLCAIRMVGVRVRANRVSRPLGNRALARLSSGQGAIRIHRAHSSRSLPRRHFLHPERNPLFSHLQFRICIFDHIIIYIYDNT